MSPISADRATVPECPRVLQSYYPLGMSGAWHLLQTNGSEVIDADPWRIGPLSHYGLWTVYTFFNVLGSACCIKVMYTVRRLPPITALDVLYMGLFSGLIGMSVTCATQCILNMTQGRFAYGVLFCDIEAIAHFTGILVQFLCNAAIGLRNWCAIAPPCHGTPRVLSLRASYVVVAIIWIVALVGTIASGRYSTIYLLASGTYCFYLFDSPAFLFWFVPAMLIALVIIIISYSAIYCMARSHERKMIRAASSSVRLDVTVARRSSAFVVIFFIGWITAVICSLYELSTGKRAAAEADGTLGVLGTMHSLAVPLWYAGTHRAVREELLRQWRFRKCCCSSSAGSIAPMIYVSHAAPSPDTGLRTIIVSSSSPAA